MNRNDKIVQSDLAEISKGLKDELKLLEGSRILITGGAGFLGKYLVATLLYLNENFFKKPCRIISIDNHITSEGLGRDLVDKNLINVNHDVIKPLNIKEDVDYIIHAAGIASPIYYMKYPLEAIDVAVNGTRHMLKLAKDKKIKSIIFFSSSEIYGDPDPREVPIKETYNGNVSSIGPRSCYDESKRLGETLCMTYFNLYKLPVKITRPFNVYGPGMKADDYRVIPAFMSSSLNSKPLQIHSSGKQTRAYCYITDAVIGFFKVLLIGKNGEAYNVGNDKTEVTVNELALVLNQLFGKGLQIKNIDYPENYPQGEPRRRCPDLSKSGNDLSYSPKVDLENGLKRTLEWCKVNW